MDATELYNELERTIEASSRLTGQRCAPGCGACCRRPSRAIEASVAEMRPLARSLWQMGEGESWLEKAQRAGAEGWCVLYDAGPEEPYPKGRCRAYDHRPLTCRLFGFAALVDGKGKARGLFSTVMKSQHPDLEARFDAAVAAGAEPPLAVQWRLRLAALDPDTELLPLNEALARALLREGWQQRLNSDSDAEPPPEGARP